MNKIYKVVWSKAKHCYVVTSELAKSQTKGCGARSLRMATVSLGVAAALLYTGGTHGLISPSVAEAAIAPVSSGNSAAVAGTFPIGDKTYSSENLHWNPSTKSVTVTASIVCSDESPVTEENNSPRYTIGNIVYQNSSITTNVLVNQDYSAYELIDGVMTRVYTNPGKIAKEYQQYIDGYSDANKDVSGYTVTVDIGSGGSVEHDEAYGGLSQNGKATNNSITVKSGKLWHAYGGYSQADTVTGNSVTINGGTIGGAVGGYTSNSGSGNATGNSVTVNDGEVNFYYGSIIGGSASRGDALDNTVTIKGGNLVNYAGVDIFGGYGGDGHNATGNKVIISNGTIGSDKGSQYENGFYVIAGYASGGNTTDNTVTIKGGKFASQNEFKFSGGKSSAGAYVYGNYTDTKTAKANDNKAEISGGTFSKIVDVYGGNVIATAFVNRGTGTATATASANNNKVIISGGTYSGDLYVYGGYGEAGAEAHATGEVATATVTTNGNTVEISGGTFSGDVNVCGGYGHVDVRSSSGATVTASTSADNNKVIISGGTINGYIHGGWATDSASGNTVTIKGNAVIGEDARIFGGDAARIDSSSSTPITLGTAANNTVNIEKAITVAGLFGGAGDAATSTGNTLNLSAVGVKSDDIDDFQTIALTNALPWENGKTVLSAKNFDFADSIKATLDISAAANLKNAGSGIMTLLASETNNDINSLNLKYYDDGSATLNSGTSSADVFSQTDYANEKNGVTLTYDTQHTVALDTTNYNKVTYTVTNSAVKTVSFGNSIAWSEGGTVRDVSGEGFTFNGTTAINAANLGFTGKANTALKTDGSSFMTLVKGATGITDTNLTPITAGNGTVDVAYEDAGKIKYAAKASGTVSVDNTVGDVKFTVNEVTLNSVDLGGWNGTGSTVPAGWTAADKSVAVNNADAITVTPTITQTILTAGSGIFADTNVENTVAFSPVKQNGVTLTGTQTNTIKTSTTTVANDTIVYEVGKKDIKTIDIGSVTWQKDAVLFDGSSATEYDYAAVTTIGTDTFDVTYAAPEKVAVGESMTLLKANETLTAIVNEEKSKAYSFTPVSGVTVDAVITGKLINRENNVVFTAAANQASQLTFGDVEWKDSGALLTRPSNITFAGADVDTSKINFTNMIYLDADRQMTLVSDFGDKVGTITGSKYRVGTAFEGEGAASLSGKDLIFRTKTGAGVSEQTHKTVMATEAGVTALNVGSDYIGKALDGMGDVANVAPDGSTVGAAVGGGKNRYETGSHVNVNSWNAAVAVGAKREVKNGSLEYGVFGEYGKANYTLHSDAGRGDGDAHYAGGGLVAKWTNKHDVYTEASFRLGRLSESSSDIMRDGLGNTYGYDVHANYYGAHVGVGKIFRYNGGRSLDVYGKYFYTKRDGVEFDAVQHYNLDSVASSVLRIGARYGTTDKKWNWYGGLAYEYEFDGEAEGVVNGTEIRAASIKGSSVRGEIGMRMNATKTNPWQMDISIYGYGGKHRGFGGNVNVAYMF